MKSNIIKSLIFFIISILCFTTLSFAKTGTIQNSDFLNLREQPSISANLVAKISKEDTFEILGEEGNWYKIKYQEYTGYVSKDYVKVNEEIVNTNIPATINKDGIMNKNSIVYILPLINSTKIADISANSKVFVISIAGKWAYIQNDTISGWVYLNNVNGTEKIESNNEENNDVKTEENVIENTTINESENKVEETKEENTNNLYPKTMYVNVDAVYIRANPSTDANIVTSIGFNTPVTVNGEEGDWYKVTVLDGSGYMMKKFLSNNKN